MNSQTATQQFTAWAILLGGLFLALLLGSFAGSGNAQVIGLIVGFTCVTALVLTLKTRIWLLIPVAMPLLHGSAFIPGPFSIRDIVIGIAAGMMLIFHALHVVPNNPPKRTVVDLLIILLFAYGVFMYIRFPAGLELFQSERIGAKPYFEFAIAIAAYWVLGRARLTPALARKLPLWIVGVSALIAAATLLVFLAPTLGPVLGEIYEGLAPRTGLTLQAESAAVERFSGYRNFGQLATLALVSYFSPLTCISPAYPFRFIAFALSCFAILISGFRSAFGEVGLVVLTSTYLRRGLPAIIALVMAGCLALILLLSAQGRLFELPFAVQRAMSFLPGDWDPIAVRDADSTTEWRVEMWKRVLDGESIQDPILGDGFGFTRAEMMTMLAADTEKVERLMLAGDYHSGPLTTVRHFGIVGLVIYTVLISVLAVKAWQLCVAAKYTPFYPVALFIGLPIFWYPVIFYLVFGSFKTELGATIIGAGMLRLVSSSFELYRQKQADSSMEPAANY